MAVAAPREIPDLVLRLRSSSAAEQAAAARALADLADGQTAGQAAVVAAGGAPALVRLLHSPRATVQTAASQALAALAACPGDSPHAASVSAAGGVPPLAHLLRTSSNQGVVEQATTALYYLLRLDVSNAAAIVAANCVPRLLQLLRGSGSKVLLCQVLLVLGKLAGHVEGCAGDIIAHGGAVLLTQRLRSSDRDLQEVAALALANVIAKCPPDPLVAAIDEAGTLPALNSLLQCTSGSDVLRPACMALGSLMERSARSAAAVAAAGCIPRLVRLLQTTDSESVLQLTAIALGNLGASSAVAAAAVAAAGGRAALQEHVSSNSERVKEEVARALRLLAESAGSPTVQTQPRPPRVCAGPGCIATTGLRRCAGCGRVRYCSVACGQAHWREHRHDCKRWQAEAKAASTAAAPAEAGEHAA